MALKEYHRKRNFKKTPEPKGKIAAKHNKLRFVIQKHAASHLHYDFRLEMEGVLKSWAVPKGPSLNPEDKRLAVHVEDHPLDYATFEGIIPKGEYGGGTVMVWDEGTWEPEIDAEESYKHGKLLFTLHGKKLQGLWTLFRMGGKAGGDGKNWLLVKKPDKFAKKNYDIEAKKPLSAKTGRTMEQIAASDEVYHDKEEPEPAKKIKPPNLDKAKKESFPEVFHPQLAILTDTPPVGKDWLHEIKFDGYRILTFIHDHHIRLMSRRDQDWTDKFSKIAEALKTFPAKNTILDGELVVLDEHGFSKFQLLQNALEKNNQTNLAYYIFDIPYYENKSLASVPLLERKQLLVNLFQQWQHKPNFILYSDHVMGTGEKMFNQACQFGLEGIVSKNINAPYENRRTHSWLKVKCLRRQEFVVGGYTSPQGARQYFGALLLGYYNKDKELVYCGKVGTGFNDTSLKNLHALFKKNEQTTSPFVKIPREKNAHWLKPKLVVEIEFTEWTDENRLRHPSFQGLRQDKTAKEVTMEKPVKAIKSTKIKAKTKTNNSTAITIAGIKLTHPDKLLYVRPAISKQYVAEYYQTIADYILPHVINRPLTLVRCPDNNFKSCFYQKHLQENLPNKGLYSIKIKGDDQPYIYIKNVAGLIALVQMNVLEIHPWGSHIKNVEKPDQLTFDLDPGPGVTWKQVIDTALLLRKNLQALGLESFVKTTGGKGLHVVVPFKPTLTWEELTQFAKSVSDYMAQQNPSLYVATMSKAKRRRKIFIDYLRNVRGANAVTAYSTRAREGAPVATPVSWDELKKIKSGSQFNIENISARLKRLKTDPWKDFFKIKQKIPK